VALVLTEDQQMLHEAARSFLADAAPVDEFRRLRDAGEAYSPDLWQQIVELGWTAIVVPEEHEGLDFGVTGAGLIAIEAGRNLLASPLFTTGAMGATALADGASDAARARLLPGIAGGEILATLAVDETNHHDPSTIRCAARRSGDGFTLDGSKLFVPEGSYADQLVVVARDGEGDAAPFLVMVVDASADGITRKPVRLMDGRDYANIEFAGVSVSASDVLAEGDAAEVLVGRLLDIGAILAACEMYGCAQRSFEQTVQYLTEREQFGQIIGTFQALQHRAAHAFTQMQLLKSVVLDALDAVDRGRPDLAIAASHAKALANDTARLVTNEAIQMHGGIGMTDDLDIGLYFKRVSVLRNMYGNSSYHRQRFAALSAY
jgi:alkylation response protein AidB-like acyl-CoA dehydrogenase